MVILTYPCVLEKWLFHLLQIGCLLVNDSFRNDFIAMLMRKQRYLTERILYLTSHDVEDRFFHFLVEQYGERDLYHMEMNKKDLAAAIGTIPETVSRLIKRLEAEGKISWDGNIIKLYRSQLK